MQAASYLSIIRRRLPVILVIPAVLGALALVNAQSKPSTYESTSTLLVRNLAPVTAAAEPPVVPLAPTETPPVVALNDLLTNDRIMSTYTELATHRVVLQAVIDALGLSLSPDELSGKIEATHVGNTQLLTISARDQNAEQAAAIANATAQAFIAQSDARFGEVGTVEIAEEGLAAGSPVSPDVEQAVLLAVVLGLLLAGLVVLLLEHADDTVKTSEDVVAVSGLSTLAVIGRSRNPARWRTSGNASLEDYRDLRSTVSGLCERLGLRSILIASHGRDDGRTATALNLSYLFAELGELVILVDADLREPELHRLTGTPNEAGLSDLLRREHNPSDWPLFTVEPGLEVLTAGPPPASPSVIASQAMAELLSELKSASDIVILDSPALSAVSDASDLARMADGTILVVEAGKTRADRLRSVSAMLEERGARVLGVVLNKGRSPRAQERHYRARRKEPGSSPAISGMPAEMMPAFPDRPVRPLTPGVASAHEATPAPPNGARKAQAEEAAPADDTPGADQPALTPARVAAAPARNGSASGPAPRTRRPPRTQVQPDGSGNEPPP